MTFAKPTAGDRSPTAETARNSLARLADQSDLALPEVFRRVCEAATESLRIERAGIWLFVNNDKVLRCVSLFERSKRKHSKGACLSLSDCPAFLRTIGSVSLLPCEAARNDPRTSELASTYLAPLGIGSVLYTPLQRDGRVVGVLFFEHIGSPREWSDNDRSFSSDDVDLAFTATPVARQDLQTSGL